MRGSVKIDLNSDIGELPESTQRDIDILSIVSSCSIACGGHAGDARSMALMVNHAKINGVRIGAHPSYPDKLNFGRAAMKIDYDDLRQSLSMQIIALIGIADAQGAPVAYVKPHGALYNDMADNIELAKLIISIIYDINPKLGIMGLSDSYIERIANDMGIEFIAEAFIDRRYTASSRLQSRQENGAVITDQMSQERQMLALIRGEKISAADGNMIKIKADSLCMHSDSDGALSNARHLAKILADIGVKISAS